MSTAQTTVAHLEPDNATRAWDLLSDKVDAFIKHWDEQKQPPPLRDFLPESPAGLRRMTLVELIKVDLEYRWQEYNLPRELTDYLVEFPELADGGVSCDLVYEEYHIRKQAGDTVDPQQYLEMFPQQAEELGRLLGMEAPHLTTSLFRAEKLPPIAPGDKLDEFDLLKQLGKGAFATVYLAWQGPMQRFVALKVSADQGTEGQTLAQLEHEHIVRVYDQKILPERRLRLMYMQHIGGGTLQTVVECVRRTPVAQRQGKLLFEAVDAAIRRSGKELPPETWTRRKMAAASWPSMVCWLGARLAAALDYAHRHNVLHRDIKPANVLLNEEGSPKLADFNISYSSEVEGASPAAYFGGSLPYMSTEQLEACRHTRLAADLDGRSDLYSLAVMLWELLTGKRPFDDSQPNGNWLEMVKQMLERRQAGVPPEAIAQLPPNCPPGLKDVLLKCLAFDRDERFATANELERELELCRRPRTQELLRPTRPGVRNFVQRFGVLALVMSLLVPHVICTAIIIGYNGVLSKHRDDPMVQAAFWDVMLFTLNGLAYSVGIIILWRVFRNLSDTVANLHAGGKLPEDELPALRTHCLALGSYVAWVGLAAWVLTGITFPSWMEWMEWRMGLPEDVFDTMRFMHFFVSHAVCGLMASALAFYLVTFVAVRHLYPSLISTHRDDECALRDIARLRQVLHRYFLLATMVPVLTLIGLAISQFGSVWVLVLVSCVALVALTVPYQLRQAIESDLRHLELMLNPDPHVLTESISAETWRGE